MGLDSQFKVCYNCTKEEIEVTTFGEDEKQFIRYTVCGRPQPMGEPLRCGFYDFCKECKEKVLMCNGTEVVNIYKCKDKNYIYIGRGSPFGNPFKIGKDGTREEVIEKYRSYFKGKLEDPIFKLMVSRLKGKKLGCFCKPQACHGDVIKEFLDGS